MNILSITAYQKEKQLQQLSKYEYTHFESQYRSDTQKQML